MPRTPGNVLRSLGVRHVEQQDELIRLAEVLDAPVSYGALTAERLRALNAAWARGEHWIKRFAADQNPLRMP